MSTTRLIDTLILATVACAVVLGALQLTAPPAYAEEGCVGCIEDCCVDNWGGCGGCFWVGLCKSTCDAQGYDCSGVTCGV
jgi:hypothetical protein